MATFQYEALNAQSGKTEKGELNVASQAEALARLQEMGLAPIKVDPVTEAPKKAKGKRGAVKGKKGAKKGVGDLELQITGLSGRVTAKNLTIFTRQLAQVTSAGLHLLSGLRMHGKHKKTTNVRSVRDGLGA